MTIVLVHPEIPQNTGTIARLCAVTGTSLELVHPLGFKTDDKHLRRAGLDYWSSVNVSEIPHDEGFLKRRNEFIESKSCRFFYLSKYGKRYYTEIEWKPTDHLVFGSESCGLNMEKLNAPAEATLRIPQVEGQRCLNLANAVSIVLYEALRQQGFRGLV